MLQLSSPGPRLARSTYVCSSCLVTAAPRAGSAALRVRSLAHSRSYTTDPTKPPAESAKVGKPRRRRILPTKSELQLRIWRETLDVLKSLQADRLAKASTPTASQDAKKSPTKDADASARLAKQPSTSPVAGVSQSQDLQVKMLAGALDLLKNVLNSGPLPTVASVPAHPPSSNIHPKTPALYRRVMTDPKEPEAFSGPANSAGAISQQAKQDVTGGKPAQKPKGQAAEKTKEKPKKSAAKKKSKSKIPTTATEATSPLRSKYHIDKINSNELGLLPIAREQPPVPRLQYNLDRALFNPGVYHLQDPRSRVWNFDPYLASIMPLHEFDFNALKQYVTSSKDNTLIGIAAEHNKKYTGSTSSMTATLSQFHYLLSSWRPINPAHTSRSFNPESFNFTRIMRAPSAAFLHYKDGTYAIDADKEFDTANVLSMLGKSMEKLLTLPREEFEKYRVTKSHQLSEEERNADEAFHYTTMGDFMMRSQLDAHDPRLLGTGMFDLKTRAVVSIRMDARDIQNGLGYEIRNRIGQWESFEREYFDMIRSAFLKYSLQVRMGRMDGIFVAFHNTQRIFGFQYISINEMDLAIHGAEDRNLGDREFLLSLHLLNKVLDRATAKFPGRSLRLHIETRPSADAAFMYIFAKPVNADEIAEVQNANKTEAEEFERNILGMSKATEAEAEESDETDLAAEAEESVEAEAEEDDMQGQDVWEDMRRKVEETMENEALGITSVRETIEDALEHSGLLLAKSPEESAAYIDALLEAITSTDTTATAETIHNSSLGEAVEEDQEPGDDVGAETSAESTDAAETNPSDWEATVDAASTSADVLEDHSTQTSETTSASITESSAEEGSTEKQLVDSSKDSTSQLSLKDLILKLAAQVEASPQEHTNKSNDEKWTFDTVTESPKNKRFERILSRLMATSKESPTEMPNTMGATIDDHPRSEESKPAAEPAAKSAAGDETSQPADAPSDPPKSEQPELLGMILTMRNKVNGAYVKRPEGLSKSDSWVVEYAIEEIAPLRAATLYEQTKKRRRDLLTTESRGTGTGTWGRDFRNNLTHLSRRGKQWRHKENTKAKQLRVHVYGREDETLSWEEVFAHVPEETETHWGPQEKDNE